MLGHKSPIGLLNDARTAIMLSLDIHRGSLSRVHYWRHKVLAFFAQPCGSPGCELARNISHPVTMLEQVATALRAGADPLKASAPNGEQPSSP